MDQVTLMSKGSKKTIIRYTSYSTPGDINMGFINRSELNNTPELAPTPRTQPQPVKRPRKTPANVEPDTSANQAKTSKEW